MTARFILKEIAPPCAILLLFWYLVVTMNWYAKRGKKDADLRSANIRLGIAVFLTDIIVVLQRIL